ncbi:uncharacterized protein [Antedon mediterranea]|uniref:uncharacterized protein n=1 Tax=Antedon mediterranea TaxID=105859 RepID=UPI003AF65EC7
MSDDYFTHPDHMRGATRQKQNVMMHKQLAHFEKCINDVKSTYFSPTHNNMLRDLVPSNVIVTSLGALRELVKREANRQHKKGIDICDSELVKHFDDFFQTIAILRRLKGDFTEKIYSVLFEFFYPVALNDVPEMIGKGGKRMSKVKSDNLSNIKSHSDITDDEDDIDYDMPDKLNSECNEMRDTIENIHHVNYRWEKLMASDEIDTNFFDPDTIRELRLYDSSKNFEYMLRLVPDIINKSIRAVELARKWWFNSDKLCKKLEQFKREMSLMPKRRRSIVLIKELEKNNSEPFDDEQIENKTSGIRIQEIDSNENDTNREFQDEKYRQHSRSTKHKIHAAAAKSDGRRREPSTTMYLEQNIGTEAVTIREERQHEEKPATYKSKASEEKVAMHWNSKHRQQDIAMNSEQKKDEDHDDTAIRFRDDHYVDMTKTYQKKRNRKLIDANHMKEGNVEMGYIYSDRSHKKTENKGILDLKTTNIVEDRHQIVDSNNIGSSDDEDNDRLEFNNENSDQEKSIVDSDQDSEQSVKIVSSEHCDVDESYSSVVHLLEEIKQVIATIGTLEKELIRQQKELNDLLKRQNRLDGLSSDVEKAKDIKDNVYVKLTELNETKSELLNKISRSKNGSLLYVELKKTLSSTEEDIMELKNAAKLHEFHHELLTSDLDVEMEMRPTLRSYSQRLQSKILEVERNLSEQVERQHVLEKRLMVAKANLKHNIKQESIVEKTLNTKLSSEQMYVYQSGPRNPAFFKPPRIPGTVLNHSSKNPDARSPVVDKKPRRLKKRVQVVPSVSPSLPEIIYNEIVLSKIKTYKSHKQDNNSDNAELPNEHDVLIAQYSDATSNADVLVNKVKKKSLKGKGKSKKKSTNLLFTPQNGGRYRKTYYNQENCIDQQFSTSDDDEYNIRQEQSDYSINGNTNLFNTNYRSERKRLVSKHVKVPKERNTSQRVNEMDKQNSHGSQANKSNENHMKTRNEKQHDMPIYSARQNTQFVQDDDVLSIPDDPDAGSSESNDSDFSEELKAKQQHLRRLRQLQDIKQKSISYARPQRKSNKKLYDSKCRPKQHSYTHFEATPPPPPPGYRETKQN